MNDANDDIKLDIISYFNLLVSLSWVSIRVSTTLRLARLLVVRMLVWFEHYNCQCGAGMISANQQVVSSSSQAVKLLKILCYTASKSIKVL